MSITEESFDNVLVIWDVDGPNRAPVAFYNQGAEETTVKAWRIDGNLHLLQAWVVLPVHKFWICAHHVDPLPHGKYRIDVRPSEVLWWTDSDTGRALDGSRRLATKALKTARIVIG